MMASSAPDRVRSRTLPGHRSAMRRAQHRPSPRSMSYDHSQPQPPTEAANNNNTLNYDDGNTSSDDDDNTNSLAFASKKRLTLRVVNADIDVSPSSSDDEAKITENLDSPLMDSKMKRSSPAAPPSSDSSIYSNNENHPDNHASETSPPPPTPLHNDNHLSDIQQPIHLAAKSAHSSGRNSVNVDHHSQQQPQTSDTSEMGSLKYQVEAEDEGLGPCTPPPAPPSMTTDARSMISTTNESVLSATMAHASQSKYSKASFTLTNQRDSLRMYRDMAEKVNDPLVQLSYAKYLLDVAELYNTNKDDVKRQSTAADEEAISNLWVDMVKRASGRANLARGIAPFIKPEMDAKAKREALEMEAITWIKRLAKEQVGEAAHMQATWIDNQKYGFAPNPEKAYRLHVIAARSGNPYSMYAVAKYLEHQIPSSSSGEDVFEYYQSAANKGYLPALLRVAKIYIHGQFGQRQNISKGLTLLSQAAENATEEYPEPIFVFGQMLANIYPEADIPAELLQHYGGSNAILRTFERAAELGHTGAQTQLGSMYEHGSYGVAMDMEKAHHYYSRAASTTGDHHGGDPVAMLGLCRLYNCGIHGPEDNEEPQRLVQDVSGWLARTGRDEDESFRWCEKAANQGHADAMFMLAWYLETGFGTPKDITRANLFYRRAASKGNQAAKQKVNNNQHTTSSMPRSTGVTTSSPVTSRTMNGRPKKTKKRKNLCIIT